MNSIYAASYISEYYEVIKDIYPHLTSKQVDNICRTNFKMIKSEIQKGSLKTIRLRYFGTFRVYKGRAIGMLNKTKKMLENGKIQESNLSYVKKIVTDYLKREYNENLPLD